MKKIILLSIFMLTLSIGVFAQDGTETDTNGKMSVIEWLLSAGLTIVIGAIPVLWKKVKKFISKTLGIVGTILAEMSDLFVQVTELNYSFEVGLDNLQKAIEDDDISKDEVLKVLESVKNVKHEANDVKNSFVKLIKTIKDTFHK